MQIERLLDERLARAKIDDIINQSVDGQSKSTHLSEGFKQMRPLFRQPLLGKLCLAVVLNCGLIVR